MPRVFVYEHVTAIGLGREPESPYRSLFLEGRAMRDAVTADFAAVPGVEVLSFPDDVPESAHIPTFRELAVRAEWSLIIAPETGCELERLAREVISVGGRLLGPSPDAIALTADKLRLADHWQANGVPTPRTENISPLAGEVGEPKSSRVREIPYPLVVKRRDGAGSDSTFLVSSPNEFVEAINSCPGPMIAQEYIPGRAASVAFLIGPDHIIPLLPAFQLISTDGRFRYEGGALPIEPGLAERTIEVGTQAIQCVPGSFGYVGFDLILGESADVAIEINPRLTTSYVGLRALAETNLAAVLLDVCDGRGGTLHWQGGRVRLDPAGAVVRDPAISFWA